MPINKIDGKKDGKQKYRVRVNYMDDFGKPQRIERTAYGLDEARAVEIQLTHKIATKTEVVKKMTVQELYEEFEKVKATEIRESSMKDLKDVYRFHLKDYFGKKPIDKLNAKFLQDWKLTLEGKGLSVRTKQKCFGHLRAMLNHAVKMEYLNINPLNKVGNFKKTGELKKEMQFYTSDEFLNFIKPAKELAETGKVQDSGFYIFFMFSYYTGARKGETNALRWCDIKNNEMCITRSVAQKLKGGDRITPPKNRSSVRNVQLPQPLLEALASHKEKCQQLDGFSDECFVCGFSRPLRDTSIQLRNEKYAEQAGVKKIRIHDFRHSHASLLANHGINIQEIARRLGHSNIEMTLNTYSHLYPKEQERALNVLNDIK